MHVKLPSLESISTTPPSHFTYHQNGERPSKLLLKDKWQAASHSTAWRTRIDSIDTTGFRPASDLRFAIDLVNAATASHTAKT